MTAKRVLPFIVIAQFLCTSLWFAGNAVMDQLIYHFQLSQDALGHLTSAVQFGFILGTLFYAIFTLADRFSPSRLFMVSALLGALANALPLFAVEQYAGLLLSRFLTGFFLAGIYPVGMKLAADYFEKGLGKALGWLVGALVFGTAFPHLLRGLDLGYSWQTVLGFTSLLAISGGLTIGLLVPDGPYRKGLARFDATALLRVFKHPPFRAAAFGYFGHMWELYAYWAFVPVFLKAYSDLQQTPPVSTSLASFFIIAIGGLGCILAGLFSQRIGSKKVAAFALASSGLCCLISPLGFQLPFSLLLIFLLIWGFMVVADSPMFSTLVAQHAPAENKGTALTIVNCIGFAITIVSIQLLNSLFLLLPADFLFVPLAAGPMFGLISLLGIKRKKPPFIAMEGFKA